MIGKIENRKHSVIFGNSSAIASWIYEKLFQLKNNTYLVGRKLTNEEDLLADFTNYDQVLNTFKTIYTQSKQLHSIYYCAGSYDEVLINESNPNKWKEIIDINLNGAFNVFRAFSEIYSSDIATKFIFLGSTATISKPKKYSSYSVSKIALEQLVNYINNETPNNVRSCYLRLGRCKTTFSGFEKNDSFINIADLKNIINFLENSRIETFPDLISVRPILK